MKIRNLYSRPLKVERVAMSRLARWWVLGRKGIDDPLVTVVKLNGILQAASGRGPQARRLLNLDRVEKWLQRAFYKPLAPAACAIVVNSPGGSPVQAELIRDMIRSLSKETGIPAITFAEDVAASGGYWLMMSGSEAYAAETSIVGSIGVISATFGAVDTVARLGIERRVWTAGAAKLPMDPFLPVKPEQESRLMEIMASMHDSFQSIVKQSRGNRLQGSDDELFSGRVWTGRQALTLGLIDGLGSMRGIMKEKYGDKTKFLLCSEPPQPGLRDFLGLGTAGSNFIDAAQERYSDFAKEAVQATLTELEERSVWDRFKVY